MFSIGILIDEKAAQKWIPHVAFAYSFGFLHCFLGSKDFVMQFGEAVDIL